MGNPSLSYGASPAIWDHAVFKEGGDVLVQCLLHLFTKIWGEGEVPQDHPTHVNTPCFNPSHTSQYLIYFP